MKMIGMSERTSNITDEVSELQETLMEFTTEFNIVSHLQGLQFKTFSLKPMC